ncbi:MAG TPA: sulfotransferase family 2 domain-containing protein [Verrucomicrobiae bacterium]
MLVSHLKRFIYTKTMKTASTSLEVYFEPYCMFPGEWKFQHERQEYRTGAGIVGCRNGSLMVVQSSIWWNHMPAASIKAMLGKELWDSYFKFCSVRNPFDKLVSAFHFFNPAAADSANLVQDFENWLLAGDLPYDRNKYTIDGEFCMDDVIRYETLTEDLRRICRQIGAEFELEKLSALKAGKRPKRPLTDYYSKDSVAIVNRLFKYELDTFGYQFPA